MVPQEMRRSQLDVKALPIRSSRPDTNDNDEQCPSPIENIPIANNRVATSASSRATMRAICQGVSVAVIAHSRFLREGRHKRPQLFGLPEYPGALPIS